MKSRGPKDPDNARREKEALEVARIWKMLDDRTRSIIYGELISYDNEVKKAVKIVQGLPKTAPTVRKEGRVIYVDQWIKDGE